MRFSVLTLMCLLSFCTIAYCDVNEGLLVYYSFDNPADIGHDDSGNGYNLTIPSTYTSTLGVINDAVSYDGFGVRYTYSGGSYNPTSSPWGPYVSTSSMVYPGPTGMTVAYWCKETDTITSVWDYWQHRAAGESFGLIYEGNQNKARFFVRTAFSDPAPAVEAINGSVSEWVHLAGVYDANSYSIKLYIDGVFQSETTLPAPMRAQNAPYFYAGGSWHLTHPVPLDEVRFYNRALSEGEIAELAKVDPIEQIVDFIEDSIANGRLITIKEGKAGEGQLNALIGMILTAGDLIKAEDVLSACEQLSAAMAKTDGLYPSESAPDFVAGPAASELADMIFALMQDLGCQ
jgi:hypothetical protein